MTENTALNPVVLIDDLNDLIDSNLDEVLSRFLQQLKTRDFSLFITGESVSIRQSFTSSVQIIRKARAGLLLVPDILSDGDIFNLSLPRTPINWTAGRGYMISSSEITLIQMAL
jgi:DNA segregation ATPase FtsK/SpoIIIE, S-DNA-T family